MPYFKFGTKEDEDKAKGLIDDLADVNTHMVKGLVAYINDPKYGEVFFFTEKPYKEEIDKLKLNYKILLKEEVSAPFAIALRDLHPEYSNEL